MLGAIAGDIIGSVFEWNNRKTENFQLFHRLSRFTDDSVMTVAIADAILTRAESADPVADGLNDNKIYAYKLKEYGRKYPDAGYGHMFRRWLFQESIEPYGSYGNGSAMRVSPIGFAYNDLNQVLDEAKKSAEVSHSHAEGIKGAQAVAGAVFLARQGGSKAEIKEFIEEMFHYHLDFRLEDIRPYYKFDVSCQGSVPQAIVAFLESKDYEDAIRKAVSIGGDSDTIACMAGGIAQAFYKEIPTYITERVELILDAELMCVVKNFEKRFPLKA